MESFDWQNYLDTNKCISVAEELFIHVEISLQNGIKNGMLLEVAHKENPDVYWIAEITMVCGHLLRIRYVGDEDEFWCNITEAKLHPLGWCVKYDELMGPPESVHEKYGDRTIELMKSALKVGGSISFEALYNSGLSPIDRIKEGMKVEVQDPFDPYRYWIATITRNVGGRLNLHYDGSDGELLDLWLFYSSSRLCKYGFVTSKGLPWYFKYPGQVNKFSCKSRLSAQLKACAEDAIKNPTPTDLLPMKPKPEAHNFINGMKLEAFDPVTMSSVKPATIIKLFHDSHFLVVIDDHLDDYVETGMALLCDLSSPYIFPAGWAARNNVSLTAPTSWSESKTFDWYKYITATSSTAAPESFFIRKEDARKKGFEINMKLEVVDPEEQGEICMGNIVNILENLLCIELMSNGKIIWYCHNSEQLFPVGWCNSNNYLLQQPKENMLPDLELKEEIVQQITEIPKHIDSEWCDRIFFNYKCYAGPFISRTKLSQLPKHVGPGPLCLVIKEVLNMMIGASYKPGKMLKDWESEMKDGDGRRSEVLKAKLKSGTYEACIPIVAYSDGVGAFCREVCSLLQACPCLFGPQEFNQPCPETCLQVDKSKFQNHVGGIERRGRPKGGLSKSTVPKCWAGKKKKRRGLHFMTIRAQERRAALQAICAIKDAQDSGNESDSPNSTPQASENGTRPNSPDSHTDCKKTRKKREPRTNYPKLEMKTRGAKLPNFAQQMKEGHWNKKDVETIYSNTCVLPKKQSESDNSEDESENSKNNDSISDVSDSEEPELKKLRYTPLHEPQPTDIKMFEDLQHYDESPHFWSKNIKITSNPLKWSISDVHNYLIGTDCKNIAGKMKEQEIDGPAFLMMNLPIIKAFLHLREEVAIRLCRHITEIKWHYLVNYDDR